MRIFERKSLFISCQLNIPGAIAFYAFLRLLKNHYLIDSRPFDKDIHWFNVVCVYIAGCPFDVKNNPTGIMLAYILSKITPILRFPRVNLSDDKRNDDHMRF